MIQRSLPDVGARALAVLGAGLLAALLFGFVAGRSPLIALAIAGGLVIAAVMAKDLAIGVAVFTVASFAGVLSTGHGASAAKAVGGLLVLAWIAALSKRSGRGVRSLLSDHRGLVVCAFSLIAWSVLSAAWAQSPSVALAGAGRWAMDLVLFPVLYTAMRDWRQVRWVLGGFVIGAIFALLYGAAAGKAVDGSRLAGALGDPNQTAAVMVAAAVLAVALGVSEQRSRVRRALAYGAAVAALVGLAATASRGGAIALGVTAVAAVAMAGRWRRRAATAALAGAVLMVAWFAFLAPSVSRTHITSLQSGRTTLWTVAGRAIAANPVVGLGNDNFSLSSSNYLIQPGATTAASEVVTKPKVAHSVYLEIWADLGVVGLLLFAGLVVLSLRAALKAVAALARTDRQNEEIVARAVVVATIGMLAADIFMSDLYSKQLFLLLALAPAMLTAMQARASRTTAAHLAGGAS